MPTTPETNGDSVLLYPDSAKARSGNQEQTKESDFANLTFSSSQQDLKEPLVEVNGDATSVGKTGEGETEPGLVEEDVRERAFSTLPTKEKVFMVIKIVAKILGAVLCLYFFVCALDVMSRSSRLLAGKSSSGLLNNEVIRNPIAGVMLGLLITVCFQSSSTSTSITVSMVSAGLLPVQTAIPIVMGANIGTSVTNTLVAFTHIQDKDQFERAFAGATVHDLFNALTTIVLLSLEVTTSYLYKLSKAIVSNIQPGGKSSADIDFLHRITGPLTNCIIIINSDVEDCWLNPQCRDVYTSKISTEAGKGNTCKSHLFKDTKLMDAQAGGILLGLSIFVICFCLIMLVKVLNSLLRGRIVVVIKKTVNSEIPHCAWLTGYLAILVGTAMTFLVQSSSVVTSTLIPLVGIGVVSVELMYPLTLGANIGTTTTALIAAFAVNSRKFQVSLQIALCHLLFNLSGILIFYPIPFMRWPVFLAKKLGSASANYRWVSTVYIFGCFLLLPIILFGLSVAGPYYSLILLIPLLLLCVFVSLVNVLQDKYPKILCKCLRTWDCLPLPLRSLKPYDKFFVTINCCGKCCNNKQKHKKTSAATVTLQESEITVRLGGRGKSGPKPSNISLNSFELDISEGAFPENTSSGKGNDGINQGAGKDHQVQKDKTTVKWNKDI